MARTVKQEEYAARRNQILDVAQRLVAAKGYEQMTIQDLLDALQISKGAFYHYFDSKPALLEAIVERMMDDAEQFLIPIVQDPHLPALEKFQRFFATAGRWKTARKTFLLELLRVWYADENAVVRQKIRAATLKRISPLLAAIIRQGVQEGVLTTAYPDQMGEVLPSLMEGFGETAAGLLLSPEPDQDALQHMESAAAAYTDALERVLGAPSGSLTLIDAETLREWFAPSEIERSAEHETVPAPGLA